MGSINCIDLSGRLAVVTGGSSGMGLAITRRLLESGAAVEIWGRDKVKLAAAAEMLAGTGSVSTQSVDVSSADSVAAARHRSVSVSGVPDILINAAGATPALRPMLDLSNEDWSLNIATNLDSVFYCCRAFAPAMVERGWGRIVNISSMAGKEGNPFQSAYSAAKAGVIALTKSLAKELATTGVTVNAVAPGLFATPMLETARNENPESVRLALEKIPMRRVGRPDESASLVAWIVSEQCSFTTGFAFDLSGGRATY